VALYKCCINGDSWYTYNTYRPIEQTENSDYWRPFTTQASMTSISDHLHVHRHINIHICYLLLLHLILFFLCNGRRFIYILSLVILIGTGVTVVLLYMYRYYYMCARPRGGWTSLRITVAICRRLWWRRAYLWGALAKLNTMENITFRAQAVWFVGIPYIMYIYSSGAWDRKKDDYKNKTNGFWGRRVYIYVVERV